MSAGLAMKYWLVPLYFPYPFQKITYLVHNFITDVLFAVHFAEWNVAMDHVAGCDLGEIVWLV